MKKHVPNGKAGRRKLVLHLEHIVPLTPAQLHQVPGGASAQDVSCALTCSKPG